MLVQAFAAHGVRMASYVREQPRRSLIPRHGYCFAAGGDVARVRRRGDALGDRRGAHAGIVVVDRAHLPTHTWRIADRLSAAQIRPRTFWKFFVGRTSWVLTAQLWRRTSTPGQLTAS